MLNAGCLACQVQDSLHTVARKTLIAILPSFVRLMSVAARSQASKVGARPDELISFQEQAVQQLRAPVTVKAIKAAIGELHLPEFLQQYA